jgi:hypothetical protein
VFSLYQQNLRLLVHIFYGGTWPKDTKPQVGSWPRVLRPLAAMASMAQDTGLQCLADIAPLWASAQAGSSLPYSSDRGMERKGARLLLPPFSPDHSCTVHASPSSAPRHSDQ